VRGAGAWYTGASILVKPVLLTVTRRQWQGAQNVPRTGGVVVAANHLSYADPFTLAHFLHERGRPPRFLAKDSLFGVPGAGALLRGAGQIPVARGSADAATSVDAAVAAARAGECVVVYPEGTITKDPDLWPMVGRTGAARIALASGAPVVPVAQWGVQNILAPYGSLPHLLPPVRVCVAAGAPMDLATYRDQPVTAELLAAASAEIVAAITDLLAGLRGEQAPPRRYDPRAGTGPARGPGGSS